MRRTVYAGLMVVVAIISLWLLNRDPLFLELRALADASRLVTEHDLWLESPEQLKATTAYGMVSILDDYSTWHDRVTDTLIRREARGHYGGFGIEIVRFDDTTLVWQVFPNSPALEAGLQMGDRLLAADTFALVGLPLDSVHRLLASIPGDSVALGLYRPTADSALTLYSHRERIEVGTVHVWTRRDDVAYLGIESFNGRTSSALRHAVDTLVTQGTEKIILDLRGNPGGLLHSAVECAELFLPGDGPIVSVSGTRPKEVLEGKRGPYPDIPLVILVDDRSASGSELMSGCLQDWDRAVLIGQPTFGKGFVQNLFPLIDQSSLRLTIGTYRTPSGRTFYRPDTTRPPDTVVYHSLVNGRTLVGGGQIFPDIEAGSPDCPDYIWLRLDRRGMFEFACQLLNQDPLPLFDHRLAERFWADADNGYEAPITDQVSRILAARDVGNGVWKSQLERLAVTERRFDGDRATSCVLYLLARHLARGGRQVPMLTEPLLSIDPVLSEAMRILDSPDLYSKILSGTTIEDAHKEKSAL